MTTTTNHEVTPARLASPGAVAHKEEPLMSTDNRTDSTPRTTAAERAFWTDLRRVTDEHDTEDLSFAAKLVHDAAARVAEPQSDCSLALDVSSFRTAAAGPDITLESRVALLEHALHETRQRCDFITWALTDLAQQLARSLWSHSFENIPSVGQLSVDEREELMLEAFERIGIDAVYRLQLAHALEITHFEGMDPSDPRVPEPEPIDPADALLAGAHERFTATRGVAGSVTDTRSDRT
jgi:hypothetical protein